MKTKTTFGKTTFGKIGKIGLFSTLAALALVSHPAMAHLTTHGVAFHHYNAPDSGHIDFIGQGVRNTSALSRVVVAPVAFSRAAGGNANVTFTIDGRNALGLSTNFTLGAYNQGLLRTSVNFQTGPGAGQVGFYSTNQTLNGLDAFSRVYCLATLPANFNSVVYGVTQLQ